MMHEKTGSRRGSSPVGTVLAFTVVLFLPAFAAAGCYAPVPGAGAAGTLNLELAAPKAVTGGSVRISSGDMGTISVPIAPEDSSVTVEVPAGSGRRVDVFLNTASATMGGSAVVDVARDAVTNVTVPINALFDTAIVLPDTKNSRVVQFTDMNGAGWTTADYASFPYTMLPENFQPVETDFDRRGRLYIANSAYSTVMPGIARIADILDTAAVDPVAGPGLMVKDLACFRQADALYYIADDYTMARINTESFDLLEFFTPAAAGYAGYEFRGLAVDDSGMLYTIVTYGGDFLVLKIDPSVPAVVGTKSVLPAASDITAKGSRVFVLHSSPGGPAVEIFNSDLAQIGVFGTVAGSLTGVSGEFYGPRRFAAVTRKRLYILDSLDYYGERIVSLDPENPAADWQTFGAYGTGEGEFKFYSMC